MSNNIVPPLPTTDKPQFVVESYVRLVDRQMDAPNPFSNREVKYRGAVSLSDMSEFVNNNLNFLEGKNDFIPKKDLNKS